MELQVHVGILIHIKAEANQHNTAAGAPGPFLYVPICTPTRKFVHFTMYINRQAYANQSRNGTPKLGPIMGLWGPKLGLIMANGGPKLGPIMGPGRPKLGPMMGSSLGTSWAYDVSKLGPIMGHDGPKLGPIVGPETPKPGPHHGPSLGPSLAQAFCMIHAQMIGFIWVFVCFMNIVV
jgi:hypothetical protein